MYLGKGTGRRRGFAYLAASGILGERLGSLAALVTGNERPTVRFRPWAWSVIPANLRLG